MNHADWPTLEEMGVMAIKASEEGFTLLLLQVDTGFEWIWRHKPSGMEFEGSCDCHERAVAFVCALESVPIIIVRPDDVDRKTE